MTATTGEITRWTRTLIPTAREAPADAETPSHILLSRAGFIRKVAAGVYDYLPLAWRTLRKISQIIREEMNAAGASELFMPVIVPIEFYAGTKRDVDYGDLLFKVRPQGQLVGPGPTHEETITEMVKGSREQLQAAAAEPVPDPDQVPRRGPPARRPAPLPRVHHEGRVLLPHRSKGAGGLNEALRRDVPGVLELFTRCGLDFTVVEAEAAHRRLGQPRVHGQRSSGEDTILKCPASATRPTSRSARSASAPRT
jgi:prolyl-tRNA synthetase